MKTVVWIAILFSLKPSSVRAQLGGDDIVVGRSYMVSSKVLNEEREIQIYLPDGYDTTGLKTYPVLYVLDGQEYFMQGVAYQKMLQFRDKTPAFIVVGIQTDRRKRRTLFYEDSEKFISFMKDELIPFIDNNFRTKMALERIYFGWEMAGGMGLEVLGEHNGLFSGFILSSSTHSGRRMDALCKLKSDVGSNEFLLFAVAPEEGWAARDSLFMSYFDYEANQDLRWRYTTFDREDHYTTANKAIHEGLSDYFNDYKPIRFYTLREYDDFGGLQALTTYYQNRGNRYDLPLEIHKETKHFLLLNATKENNYERFDYYENEFDGFLESYTRPIWFNRFGRFYLANDKTDLSIGLFNSGLSKFPNSALLHNGLGEVYQAMGKRKLARQAYERAIKIAIENSDPELAEYQKNLNGL